MTGSGSLTEELLEPFPNQRGGRRLRIELLAFWSRYPDARFTACAVSRALDCRKLDATKALRIMVAFGLIDTHLVNGETFYSLTTNESRRDQVVELVSIAS